MIDNQKMDWEDYIQEVRNQLGKEQEKFIDVDEVSRYWKEGKTPTEAYCECYEEVFEKFLLANWDKYLWHVQLYMYEDRGYRSYEYDESEVRDCFDKGISHYDCIESIADELDSDA